MTSRTDAVLILSFVSSALVCLLSCGEGHSQGTNTGGPQAATVTVTLSDPVVCSTAQGGPFQHIYVAISDVQAFPDASTLTNGVDLTPNLAQNPMQIDLLASPGAGCVLATLGSSTAVPLGSYQAMQVFLAGTDQISKIAGGTRCPNTSYGPAANCAVLADSTAIDFDPGATGTYPFNAGVVGAEVAFSAGPQTLNIDFDSCASMAYTSLTNVATAVLDPTMHAALMPSAGSITGKLIDSMTQHPISGNAIVALELADSSGVDREIMQTAPGTDGSFVLCPMPPGKYEVVASAVDSNGIAYGATVTIGAMPGNSLGNVPMQAVSGTNKNLAGISGQVTIAGPSQVSGYTPLTVSALQSASANGTTVLVTVPLAEDYTSAIKANATATANYQLPVAAGNPLVGVFSSTGTSYLQDSTSTPAYTVGTQSSCTPASVQSGSSVRVSPGVTSAAPTIALVGCPPA